MWQCDHSSLAIRTASQVLLHPYSSPASLNISYVRLGVVWQHTVRAQPEPCGAVFLPALGIQETNPSRDQLARPAFWKEWGPSPSACLLSSLYREGASGWEFLTPRLLWLAPYVIMNPEATSESIGEGTVLFWMNWENPRGLWPRTPISAEERRHGNVRALTWQGDVWLWCHGKSKNAGVRGLGAKLIIT